MKKFVSFLMAVIFITCTFCSCGKSGSKATEGSTSTSADTTSQVAESSAETESATDTTTASDSSTETAANGTTTKASGSSSSAKKTTTKKSSSGSGNTNSSTTGKYEVSAGSVKNYAGTVLRAWKISSGSVSVEIHKVAYGSKITQNFVKGNGENQDRGMDVSSKTVTYQPVCDIAIISCSPTQITFGVSKQLLGTDKGDVEDMAQKAGALVAVNGEATDEYATDHSTIRSGKVYVTSTSIRHSPFVRMYRNGTWNTGDIDYTNQDQLIKDGVYNSVRHQGTPLWDGKLTGTNDDTYYHNRTMLAQISANKYILAVGEFMPIASMASLLKAYGAKNAILLNGGNCSFMYAKGVGNVTGTKASLLKNLNKINVVETEFFASNGMLGLNSSGKQKLGGPDEEIDIVYVK